MAELPPKKDLSIEQTTIPSLLVVHLPVHGDARGWFKDNWQREKMVALGLPNFNPDHNNASYNAVRGLTVAFITKPWWQAEKTKVEAAYAQKGQ